jgi:hypothetical protein
MRASGIAGLAGLALLLAACNDDMQAKATNNNQHATDVQKLAEQKLKSDMGEAVALRSVHTYSQTAADTTAVCGQVRTGGNAMGAAYTLFVSIVKGNTVEEMHVATTGPTASRVFAETLTRCYEGGGPPTMRQAVAPPVLPALPDRLPEVARADQAPPPLPVSATPAAQAAMGGASGQIQVQRAVNLRSNPNGGGEVLRVLSAGSTAQIFGEAPGGWLQVGEGQPWGWVHGSMVSRQSRS